MEEIKKAYQRYNSSVLQRLYKKISAEDGTPVNKDVFPVALIQGTFDAITGERLDDILTRYNYIDIEYRGSEAESLIAIPTAHRRYGLIVSYRDYDNNTVIKQYRSEDLGNKEWINPDNWKEPFALREGTLEEVVDDKLASDHVVNQIKGISETYIEENVRPDIDKNTTDINEAFSQIGHINNSINDINSTLEDKVDKEDGKGLSTNDFTESLKIKLNSLNNYDDTELRGKIETLITNFNTLLEANPDEAINNFNEIINFLEGIEDSETLEGIIGGIETQIASINTTINNINATHTSKLTELENSIETINNNISDIDNDIVDINQSITSINNTIEEINNNIENVVDESLEQINTEIDKLNDKSTIEIIINADDYNNIINTEDGLINTLTNYATTVNITKTKFKLIANNIKFFRITKADGSSSTIFNVVFMLANIDNPIICCYNFNKLNGQQLGIGYATIKYNEESSMTITSIRSTMYIDGYEPAPNYYIKTEIDNKLNNKVSKDGNKQLSTEDFTTELKNKLLELDNYNDAELNAKIDQLKTALDTILDAENTTAVIDTFQEVEAFLDGITNTQTLTGLLQELKQDIINLCASTYVSLTKEETVSGVKTFTNGIKLNTDSSWTNSYRSVPFSANGERQTIKYYKNENDGISYNPNTNDLKCGSFTKIGGTAAQFLKANGTVDSNTYIPYKEVTKAVANGQIGSTQILNVKQEELITGHNNYYYVLNFGGYSGGTFNAQIALPYQSTLTDSEMLFRTANGETWRAWRTVLHSGNYSSYALPKSGGTISNSNFGEILEVKRSISNASSAIKFSNNDEVLGHIGIASSATSLAEKYRKQPLFYPNATSDGYKLIWHEGNDGSGSGLDADTVDGIQAENFSYNRSPALRFLVGTSRADITTTQFLNKLAALGAFNKRSYTIYTTWEYGSNDTITDTNCGIIQLAGCVIEVFTSYPTTNTTSIPTNGLKIRITTAPTVTEGAANSVFIYRNHGSTYSPNWKRLVNSNGNVATSDSTKQVTGTVLTNQNLNTITDGFKIYSANSSNTCTNKPTGVTAFSLVNIPRTTATVLNQIIISHDNIMYSRGLMDSGWTSWKKLMTFDDIYKGASIATATSDDKPFTPLGMKKWTEKTFVKAVETTEAAYTALTTKNANTLYCIPE